MKKRNEVIFFVMVAWTVWSVPVVSNVRLVPRDDFRTVDIWYALTGERGIITLGIETNGVALPDGTVTRLTGDIAVMVTPGENKHIVWQAGKDWPEQMVTNARAKVTAWATNAPPPYMVVDLSGGSASTEYPVTYYSSAAALPDGGLTNAAYRTTRMVMRFIPSGVFYMGSPVYEPYRSGTRECLHRVTLTNDYYIGVYPVTQRQWVQVAGSNPSKWCNPDDWETRPVEYVSYQQIRECGTAVNTDGSVDWPSTADAAGDGSFMDLLRKRTGMKGFDLPTDAQWEYACRAGTMRSLNIKGGITLTNNTEDANMNLAGRYQYNGGWLKNGTTYIDIHSTLTDAQKALVGASNATAKVGSYLPNAWGLYDMHGNVYEWVLDRLVDNLGYLPVTEPVGGSSGNRVLRGGSYYHQPGGCCSADRGTTGQNALAAHIGFRVKCKVQ